MTQLTTLGIDLGASSGRIVAGQFDGTTLTLNELFRFPNGPTMLADRMYWNLLELWSQVQQGLTHSAAKLGTDIRSVGVDTWGVDFGLLGRNDELLGNPVHYRDKRTTGMQELAFAKVGRAEIFANTGLQFMTINTLYQLMAMQQANSPLLEMAETFLMMGDLFHWLLTGEKASEYTNSTTTQFLNPVTKTWSTDLLSKLSIPTRMLGRIIEPGTVLGKMRPSVVAQTGLKNTQVIVPGTHDTASAVLAVPANQTNDKKLDWCYISSGTWSLMGVEVAAPVINDRSLALNFTNEGGVANTTRLLKNIGGLWLIQECQRIWKLAGNDYSWDQLTQLAAQAEPLRSLVNPNDQSFMAPDNMQEAIREFCRRTSQPVPETPGQIVRTALESLALCYRQVLGWLEELTGAKLNTIHIVGGGSNNKELNRMTAAATGRRVVAGPVEATAIGNVLMQLIALGEVKNIEQARDIVRRSFPVTEIVPERDARWDDAFARYIQF